MPYVTDEAMQELATHNEKQRAKLRAKSGSASYTGAKGRKNVLMAVGEAAGAAGVMGYLRGNAEKKNEPFTFMEMDIELLAGVALVGLPISGLVKGKLPVPAGDLVNIGMGILAHYAGQLGRKYANLKEGDKMTFVAGIDTPQLAMGRHNQFSLPHSTSRVGSTAGLYAATSNYR